MYAATFVNDLEAPAFEVVPALRELRDDLRKFGFQARDRTEIGSRSDRDRTGIGDVLAWLAQAVMLSGSGSTIFCVGLPTNDIDTWQDEIMAKHDVEVYEELFCRRALRARLSARTPL